SGFPPATNTLSLNGSNGFMLQGATGGDTAGQSVATADFNKDGIDDVVIGASGASPSGRTNAGQSYVLYGKASGLANVHLPPAAGSGVRFDGAAANNLSGYSVASAGDINNDGYDDVIVGAPFAGSSAAGAAYVFFSGPNPINYDV